MQKKEHQRKNPWCSFVLKAVAGLAYREVRETRKHPSGRTAYVTPEGLTIKPQGLNMSTRKTHDAGRDSESGRFVTPEYAEKHPKTTTIERVPNPGRGDTKGEPPRKK